ncbi:MAG: glycine zipper 2TM domain-containing protein [Planctomycetota bacterium]|jgi:hypothetical protein
MKTAYHFTLLAVALFIAGCSSGESYVKSGFDFAAVDKVAVVDVTGDISGEAAKNQIADFFVMELLKKGYSPVERAQVQKLLQEQQFQASDVTTTEGVAQAGRILNVPTVLVVNIPTFKEDMSMTAKMIDVEDGSILWMGSGSGTTGQTLSTIAGAAAGAAAGVAVTGKDDRLIGGLAGGALGGVAGRALSPQAADKAREIIRKICYSLPYRHQAWK